MPRWLAGGATEPLGNHWGVALLQGMTCAVDVADKHADSFSIGGTRGGGVRERRGRATDTLEGVSTRRLVRQARAVDGDDRTR